MLQASAGGWYHVAWVYDGQCLKVYVDCVLQQTITMSGTATQRTPWYWTRFYMLFCIYLTLTIMLKL